VPTLKAEYLRLQRKLQRELSVAFMLVLQEIIPRVLNNIMRAYDSETGGLAPAGDRASPDYARSVFLASVKKSLDETLKRGSNTFSFSTGDISELYHNTSGADSLQGYLKSVGKNPQPLQWLVFYLEGFGGEFAFITNEVYDKLAKAGLVAPKPGPEFKKWGWYQQGFMIERAVYYAQGLNQAVPFASVRHPQSGMRPAKIFERAMDGIDMSEMFGRAVKAVLGG